MDAVKATCEFELDFECSVAVTTGVYVAYLLLHRMHCIVLLTTARELLVTDAVDEQLVNDCRRVNWAAM